jgi:hypothetical protein
MAFSFKFNAIGSYLKSIGYMVLLDTPFGNLRPTLAVPIEEARQAEFPRWDCTNKSLKNQG